MQSQLSSTSPEEFLSPSESVVASTTSNRLERDFLVDVLTHRQQKLLVTLAAVWCAGLLSFYLWWLQSEHFTGIFKFAVNTLLVTWMLVLPGYWLFFVLQMKRVNPLLAIPSHWRVAMVTTRAPSEPFEVVQRTLLAMLQQQTPHDTWLADEDPSDEIIDWCESYGIRVVTRRGIAAYHRDSWPRRTKCKEGNLAFFYDHFGYEGYDFVAQLDADHVPEQGYLEAILRPFLDPSIGYVSAPSICDSNAIRSWSARGRLYSEALMHGPLQAGYSNGYAPLCIGSHYAVRTEALREIGGLGPELAEDHSTTLLMNSHGWRGIHALDAIAHGEGPATFADCVTQEFQWSRSLMVLLLTFLPQQWRLMPWKARVPLLFSELWYPLFSLSVLAGLMLPVLAIVWCEPWVEVSYVDFLLHSFPLLLILIAIQQLLRQVGVLRPYNSPVLSWEVALFQTVRWPWSLYGLVMGVWMSLRKPKVEFRVTPKGGSLPTSLSWKILCPYAVILLLTYVPSMTVEDAGPATGYYFFVILTQITYIFALLGLVLVHVHEVARNRG